MKSSNFNHFSSLLRGVLAGLSLTVLVIPLHAASTTFTYTDTAGTGNWNTATNWSPSARAPGIVTTTTFTNTDVALFNSTAGTTAGVGTVTDSGVNRNLQEIEFTNQGVAGDLGSYTIGSAADTLYFTTSGTAAGTASIYAGFTGTVGNIASPTQTIASNLMATHSSVTVGNEDPNVGTDLVIAVQGSSVLGDSGYDGTLNLTGNISTVAASGNSDILFYGVVGASNTLEDQGDIINSSGVISDGVHATVSVYHANYVVLDLSGANTFSGGFTQGAANGGTADGASNVTMIGVDSVGTVGAITSSAFGTGNITYFGGVIQSDSTSSHTILNPINFGLSSYNGGSYRSYGFGSTTDTGTLTLAGPVSLFTYGTTLDPTALNTTMGTSAVALTANSNVIISGQVSGSQNAGTVTTGGIPTAGTGGILKGGFGDLTLSNITGNTYHGTTTFNGGALIVSNTSGSATGDGAVIIQGLGTLGGSGTIVPSFVTSGIAVSFLSGSTLNPSVTALNNAVGNIAVTSQTAATKLTFSLSGTSSVNLANGTKFVFDLGANTATSDEVLVTGGVLAFNTQVFTNFTFNAETGFGAGTYTLMDATAGSISGGLSTTAGATSGTLDGGLYNGTLSIVGNDLDLTVTAAVPEPSTWALMLGGLSLLVAFRFRAFRKEFISI